MTLCIVCGDPAMTGSDFCGPNCRQFDARSRGTELPSKPKRRVGPERGAVSRAGDSRPGTLGYRVRRGRLDAGLTQHELATAIGASPTTVVRVENNQTDPALSTLERIAKGIRRPITWLVTYYMEDQDE